MREKQDDRKYVCEIISRTSLGSFFQIQVIRALSMCILWNPGEKCITEL